MCAQNKGNDHMKKLFNAVFAALLITGPALAGDAFQGFARAVPAANNMATAQVAIGPVATKLVASRAGRQHLQFFCNTGNMWFGALSSVTPQTGIQQMSDSFDNYAGPLYAITGGSQASCQVLEIY
jgi:hypothetical protein